MTKRFPDATADDRNEARPKGAGNADEPLKQSEPVEEVTHMPFEHDYGDSTPEFNDYFYGDLARTYLAYPDTDAELLWRMSEALRVLRPSVIVGMVRAARDEKHLSECLMAASVATVFPDDAHSIAGKLIDGFLPSESQKADHAYNLVLLAAAQKVCPDEDWQHVSAVTKRLIEYFK